MADAAALATLSAQLGYPTSTDALADRLGRVLQRTDQVVLVGCGHANAILGWIHGAEQDLLEAERRCEILGLVVDQTQRRRGIGRRLVSAVEQWASSRGLLEISVRSNVVRPASHPFYGGLGYQRVKTQHVYRKRLPHVVLTALACWALALGVAPSAIAQTGGGCEPVSQRARRELGCFITAREDLGIIPRDSSLYWHIDAYSTRAAAEAAKGPRGTVVESLGRVWLFTIANATWRPFGGERVAAIGPLPWAPARSYAAVYMEGVFQPGMQTQVHRHPGVEAWYTLEGEQCLETPAGKLIQRAGDPGVMVRAGVPMILTGTGKGLRRSLVLILQDASKPRSTPATDWTPKGLCN